MAEISIIVPAYNEEERIGKTIKSNYEEFKDNTEIIVVSNGSTDGTVEIVKSLQKKFKNVKLAEYPTKLGKGGAIIKGIEMSKGDIIGFIDSDDAVSSKDIRYTISHFKEGYDAVICSKWKGTPFRKVTEPFIRKVLSRVWNLVVRITTGLKFKDTQAGAKFFTREIYNKTNPHFISKGFEFDVELLLKLVIAKAKILEVFVKTEHVRGSKFCYKYILEMLTTLICLIWNYKIVKSKRVIA